MNKKAITKNKYQDFVNSQKETTCLQMWEWAEFRNKVNPDLFKRVTVTNKTGDIIAAATYTIYKYKFLGNVLYIPHGPIWKNGRGLKKLTKNVMQVAQNNSCITIVAEPKIKKNSQKFKEMKNSEFQNTARSVQPKHTILYSLEDSVEKLMADLDKKTRYKIRLAGRRGIKIKKYHSPDDIDRIDIFYKLLKETQKRKYFFIQSKKYYQELWKEFSSNSHAILLEASYKDTTIGSLILIYNDNWSSSIYSASSRKYSKHKGTYLLRWKSILEAKKAGCSVYDFFGATNSDDENHPFYYTTRFKLRFGDEVTEFAGTFEIVLDKIRYNLWKLLQKIGVIKFYQESYLKEFKRKNE